MSDWIDAADGLPSPDKEVWVYDEDEGVIAGLYYSFCGWYDACGDWLSQVTHWMPMDKPDPPGPSEIK